MQITITEFCLKKRELLKNIQKEECGNKSKPIVVEFDSSVKFSDEVECFKKRQSSEVG